MSVILNAEDEPELPDYPQLDCDATAAYRTPAKRSLSIWTARAAPIAYNLVGIFWVAPPTNEGMNMKALSLAFVASFAIVANATAQTAPPAAASAPATSSSSSSSVSHDCKKEAKKLCGKHAGSEMQACIKSNLDLNKFSAACATEFQKAAAAKKPSS